MSKENLEHKEFNIPFRCPYCEKLSTVPVQMNTDDESVLTAFELLSAFEMKGEPLEESKD